MKKAKEKGKRKKASVSKMCFLLAQTFSLKEKLYQKNYSLSTGSFFRKEVFCEQKKCWYKNVLFIAFVLFVILAFASSLCPTASAGDYGEGCPLNGTYNGTVRGGIYLKTVGSYGTSLNGAFYDVPDGRKITMLYFGIWEGSRGKAYNFTITINGNQSDTYHIDDSEELDTWCDAIDEPECHVSITGCGVNFVSYNATPLVVTGTNDVSITLRMESGDAVYAYQTTLFVVYENESMPEIQYWVKEGHEYPDIGVDFSMYFNETVNTGRIYTGSIESLKYWTIGFPHCFADEEPPCGWPTLNGNGIDEYDYVYSYGVTGPPSEWKPPKTYTTILRWDNIPSDYMTAPNNLFYYCGPGNLRLMVPILMLNYSEPGDLNVTDISPESLCVDYYNSIDATIVNTGGTAHFFNATLYVDGGLVDIKRVTNLGEGESTNVSFLWKPPATGSYVLNVTADVENVVRETDETNNSKTLSVVVTEAQPPEWSNQSSSVPEIPEGGTIELRVQGRADIGLDRAILATNETGTWINHTDYGSPMDMASLYSLFFTHTSKSDWKAQTHDNVTATETGEDVKLYQSVGTTNLAYNKTAYAKDSYSTYTPDKAVDGLASPWESDSMLPPASGGKPNWWYVNLSEVTTIRKIHINIDNADYGPFRYDVYISSDNETWTKKKEESAATSKTFTNLDWSCRYVNITYLENMGTTSDYAALNEFEAYGPGDYAHNGTLTSSTITTDNPIVAVTPEWNSTEPVGTNLSVNVSVDGGATWKPAVKGSELTWDYDVLNNTKLKYKVLFETTDVNETPVLHDITLNYVTRDPIEGEWLWSNFTWQNASIPGGTTVGWKIYYEDMLGQTNCTDVKTFVVGAQDYNICGYTDPAADKVNFTNLNKSEVVKDRPADYIDPVTGFYNLTLNVPTEIEAGNVLRIVACDAPTEYESNCNVTDHTVVNAPGEDTNVNLTLNHYCLNYYPDYPYKTWEQTNWSGPAVMQMLIYHYRPQEPGQSDLNATGIAHNQNPCNSDLLQVDPAGMSWTLNNILHNTSSYGGGPFANYGIGNYTTVENALWYICYWQYAGPGAAPTYGNYSNWMSIRGIHTSENPKWQSQGSYDIYGFWINDPNPTTGGIGENTYKSVDQWTGTYFKNLTGVRDCDSYKNRYVAVCEPPEQEPAEVRLVHSKARFSGTITAEATDEELAVDVDGVPLNQVICSRKLAREKEIKVVQAAIDGVNEQLAFDFDFKKTFAGTVAGKPMPVKSDAGDYYLVPFGIESDSKSVLVVVIVDSDGGKFKEASWVKEPVKYLSVTPQEALKIVYKEMKGKSTVKVLKKEKATGKLKKADVIDEDVDTLEDITYDETEKQRRKAYLELVYQDKSPYYPVWKITIGNSVFFVDQSGTLITTPTPTPKSIELVLQIVE